MVMMSVFGRRPEDVLPVDDDREEQALEVDVNALRMAEVFGLFCARRGEESRDNGGGVGVGEGFFWMQNFFFRCEMFFEKI